MSGRRDPAVTSRMMAAVRGKDTRPEMTLRRHLFARGLRYRVHDRRLPGHPDLVFAGAKLAVFVDGDFWHGAGWRERGLSSMAEQFPTRREFWVEKIRRNVERDQEVNAALLARGWEVFRVFASVVERDVAGVGDEIAARVAARREASGKRDGPSTGRVAAQV